MFKPKQILNIFTDFDIKGYADKGFKTIFLDVDNTIAVPNTGTCDERAEKFINDLKNNGYKVLIFSNNNKKRVKMFIRDIDVDYWHHALKPLPFCFWLACLKYHSKPSKTIVLGDQLLTDILGANLSGCYGIYTKQLQVKDSKLTSINRKIEKLIWRNLQIQKM